MSQTYRSVNIFSTAWSQETTLLTGTVSDSGTKDRSEAWQLEYDEDIADQFNFPNRRQLVI